MNNIVMIIPYFGKWPEYMDLYLYSCSKNPQIDFLFFTDCALPNKVYINTIFKRITFVDYCKLVSDKLYIDFNPKDAYKLCDLKPFYGVIHESDIKQYDWWIFGDMDLVHGDLSIIVNDENLKKYDLITTHCYHVAGHFTVIRKSSKYTRCCLCIPQWQSLLLNNEHQGVDEGVWCHVVYPQLGKVRSFYEHIWKKISNQDLWGYLAWTNRVFCNRLTKRAYIEYYTTPDPLVGQTWSYKPESGRVYRYDGKELPYLHFFGFKNNCYRPKGYTDYWKDGYYELPNGWEPTVGKKICIDINKIEER